MSIINTQPPKGKIYPATLHPKGEINNLRFAKGQLEELAAEYSSTKPKHTLEETAGPDNAKIFVVRFEVEDRRRENKFSTVSNGERKIRSAEQEAARKMLTALEKLYFFSEEKTTCNIIDEQYVICMDNPATLLIKLYKSETCCEYCYLRGHTMADCKKQIKRNKRLLDEPEPTEEDFWGPPKGDENTNLIYLTP